MSSTAKPKQELRKDPIIGRWVIIAPERLSRPQILKDADTFDPNSFDPFLAGNEDATTPEILAYRDGGAANASGWRVRVIPNMFPAVRVEGNLDKRGDGMYDAMNALGAHEVIVECPHRETNMSRLSVENIQEVLWVYRDRLVDLKRDHRLVHGLIFKNKGLNAGASLDHSHSQLIVTPIVPITILEELNGALAYYNFRGRNIFDDMLQQEIKESVRVVLETEFFAVICPYASRFAFETWIIPKVPGSHYENITKPMLEDLAIVMKTMLGKLEIGLDDPAYNYVIHTAPFSSQELPHYRWHIEMFPRMNRTAGFEWGSGFYINPVTPESAAKFLREVEFDL